MDKDKIEMSGKAHNVVGESSAGLILRTSGSVKVLWGSKFIDLIKDGKLNVSIPDVVKKVSSEDEIRKDGIYVIGDKVLLKIGDKTITLIGEIGTTYVSFLGEQETTSEQKHTALTNIGFLVSDISEITTDTLLNGIVYSESNKKLYTIINGNVTEYTADFPNPYTKLFVLAKSDNSTGTIVILGEGKTNSLAFNNFYIWSNSSSGYIDAEQEIHFLISDADKIVISNNKVLILTTTESNTFLSIGATQDSGFKLYLLGGLSTLIVDNLIVRHGEDDDSGVKHPIYPEQFWTGLNTIDDANFVTDDEEETEDEDENDEDDEDPNSFLLELDYPCQYIEGDILGVYVTYEEDTEDDDEEGDEVTDDDDEEGDEVTDDEDEESTAELLLLRFTVTAVTDYTATVSLVSYTSMPYQDIIDALKYNNVFLIASNSRNLTVPRMSEYGLDIIENPQFIDGTIISEDIQTRIGDIGLLPLYIKDNNTTVSVEGNGIYSGLGIFEKAAYTSDYQLADDDESSRFASTEWVMKKIKLYLN